VFGSALTPEHAEGRGKLFHRPIPFFSRKRRRRDRSVDVIALSPIGVRAIGDARCGNPFQPAGQKTTPSSVSPVVTKRQSAMSSLRASATIIVLRVPA